MTQTLIKGINDNDVGYKIASEGFEYFFTSYISLDNIIDPELRIFAEQLSDAVTNIEILLEGRGIEIEG